MRTSTFGGFPVAGIFLNDSNIVKAADNTVVSAEHDPALRRADVARPSTSPSELAAFLHFGASLNYLRAG
ncbi:hypothetical protein EXN32_18720 [Agrobacterium tumefaciens]|nr:hypothetical protein EXN32_18720 [Agrobacterium tumefaciens]